MTTAAFRSWQEQDRKPDGSETCGVTGVALISFILLAVHEPQVQVTQIR